MSSEVETGCCPRFNPEPRDAKEVNWEDRLFLKDTVRSFLHIPLNFGLVMVKNMQKIESAGAHIPEPITLADDKSLWRTDVYIAVDKEVPGAEMDKISGTFLTRVFEGGYKNSGKWMKEMKAYVASKGKQVGKMYSFYTTCPGCAKVYSKDYVVLMAKV